MDRIPLNERDTGITCGDHSFMVAGYLSDYKLTFDKDILNELESNEKKHLTVEDFKENKGYVDEEGYIHIFRKEPKIKELIPWFTVGVQDDGTPKLIFNPHQNPEIMKKFRIERVQSLSAKSIIADTTDKPVDYDPDVSDDIARSTKTFAPQISDSDDFLKKLIKTAILEKGCNVNRYKKKLSHGWTLSNYTTSLAGTTKVNPFVFEIWMEVLGCDVEIVIRDNGLDPQDPLPHAIHYNLGSDKITIEGENDDENQKEKGRMSRSAKQFN